jgi:cytoskeletal protein CcmA (bactofilin family)
LAQIIKNRRGSIVNLKAATANNAELIVASGSISDLSGPFVFIGSPNPSDNGSAGAFRAVSKVYTGTSAPTISNLTYGTTLDGTPFYATGNKSFYILNNDGTGNSRLDLTGNIEDKTILNVQIDTLSGSVEVLGDVTASNLQLSGNANIDGNITLAGNITIGDGTVDIIDFNGVISSSLIPSESLAFDLGSPTNQWSTVYTDTAVIATASFGGDLSVSGSAEISGGVQLLTTLDVDGQTTLASVNVQDLTDGRVVLAGTNGELEDSLNLTFDGTTLTTDGNVSASGQLNVDGNTSLDGTLTVGGDSVFESDVFISGSLTLLGSATELIISSSTVELDDNIIRLNAYSPFERYAGFEVIDSGSVGVSASVLWDSQNDYWLIQSSSAETGKIISTTFGTFGSETSLTTNTIPKATGDSAIGNSLLTDNSTTLAYDTDALTVAATSGNTSIKGIVTLTNAGGTDGGTNSAAVLFRNASNQLGYVSTTETTNVLDGILGYRASTGTLEFSTVIDGGHF